MRVSSMRSNSQSEPFIKDRVSPFDPLCLFLALLKRVGQHIQLYDYRITHIINHHMKSSQHYLNVSV